ncbi:hypothetical protein ACJMK2_016897 [Sinanodonta woodiana]|uniref:FAS1 domain-containing protein n=1 Tax=Sinanodonta woodiana TaxID=1069815 RepID=A0ABD3UV67_SINWO
MIAFDMINILAISLVFIHYKALGAELKIPELAKQLGATTLLNYVKTAGLDTTLEGNGPFTLFAPTNEAFDSLPTAVKEKLATDKALLKTVLLFHVTNSAVYSSQLQNEMLVKSLDTTLEIRINIYKGGQVITADGSQVINPNQNATNGVIHVVDKVLYPLPDNNIPQYVAFSPELSTLLYCVLQGQLTDVLSGQGPFTLFAPDNTAFENLPPGVLSDLLSNETALVDVLKYHVVTSTQYSKGLVDGDVPTFEGKTLKITVEGGVMVNDAKVLMADESVSNGVIHVIDKVLLPPK